MRELKGDINTVKGTVCVSSTGNTAILVNVRNMCKSSTCKVSYHCNTQFLCFEFYMLTNVELGLRLENILFC